MRSAHASQPPDARVPRLAADCDPTRLSLSPSEGYLLSRVDGATPWSVLREIGGLAPAEVDRCLERWLKEGVIECPPQPAARGAAPGRAAPGAGRQGTRTTREAARPGGAERAGGPRAADRSQDASQATGAPSGIQVDPSLDLDPEVQRRILDFAARLERPYHEILGVGLEAEVREVKKAYFGLSKILHPDRYFRRDIGPYGPLVERCFKKLLEAYELLSDPATRGEVQREAKSRLAREAAAASARGAEAARAGRAAREGAGTEGAPAGPPPRARDAARRLRLRALRQAGAGRGTPPGLAERRRKAQRFFEAGLAAFDAGRWREAAGSVRLAIAFDPTCERFRERFVEVQRRAHQERAGELLEEAEGLVARNDGRKALPLLEEAAQLRPGDVELHARAARLTWQLAKGRRSELEKARRLAAAACEVEPERADLHLLLGRICKEEGRAQDARRAFEAALAREPRSAEAKAELSGL